MRANLDYCNRNMLTKKFWSHVKSSKNSSRIPEVMSYEGLTANEPLAKANMFNQYFYKQFSEPSCYETNIEFDNDITFDIDFSAPKVKLLLDNLDINKAQGPDAISGAVLKNCSEALAYPLSILFNLSYNTGYIPQEWKFANVVPVHKKDDKNKVINYRPISLTSLVMKVFERILYDELLTRTIDKIDKRQHGFLRNRSCNSNLLIFTESIAQPLHEKIGTDIIYFDFAKAFDTVSHDLILKKLKTQYNIDGTLLKFLPNICVVENSVLFWIMSYLKVYTYCQVFHRAQFWAHYFLYFLLMIYMQILIMTQILPYSQMIPKFGATSILNQIAKLYKTI